MMLSFVVSAVFLHAVAFYRLACFLGLWSAILAEAQTHDSQAALIFPLILSGDLSGSRAAALLRYLWPGGLRGSRPFNHKVRSPAPSVRM